jgi:hypothetical protein
MKFAKTRGLAMALSVTLGVSGVAGAEPKVDAGLPDG